MDIRGQLAGLGSVLPPGGFWGLKSGAWQQGLVNLPAPSAFRTFYFSAQILIYGRPVKPENVEQALDGLRIV